MTETTAGAYRFWTEERVRFADLDALGHVNNNAISTYFESARVDLFTQARRAPLGDGGIEVVLASIRIDFRAELRYPAQIRVGTRVARIGRSSVALVSAVFEGDRCIASCEAACVLFDLASRRPAAVPDDLRLRLQDMAG